MHIQGAADEFRQTRNAFLVIQAQLPKRAAHSQGQLTPAIHRHKSFLKYRKGTRGSTEKEGKLTLKKSPIKSARPRRNPMKLVMIANRENACMSGPATAFALTIACTCCTSQKM